MNGPHEMSSGKRMHGGTAGFTLLETLVAVMVLAICLVVIMQLFSGALKAGKRSEEYTRGVLHAREKMEEGLLSKELIVGLEQGEFEDGYRWEREISRLEEQEEFGEEAGTEEEETEAVKLPFDKFRIRVAVIWQEGDREKGFEISTMQLANESDATEAGTPEGPRPRNPLGETER